MKKIRKLMLLALLPSSVFGQSCDCDVIIDANYPGTQVNFSNLSSTGVNYPNGNNGYVVGNVVMPGVTVCMKSWTGVRSFTNISGTLNNRITVRNIPDGTVTTFNANNGGYALSVRNSNHFRITGEPCDPSHPALGWRIVGTSGTALTVEGNSSDFELDHLEIFDAGSAGIKAKNDIDCSNSTATSLNGFVMRNVRIHNNYIHDVGTEGMYIGNSFYRYKQCGNTIHEAHDLASIHITNNRVDNVGWDGIQTGGVVSDANISNNTITNTGIAGVSGQASGIQFGDGCSGRVFNNWIEKTYGHGIICTGMERIELYQNVVLESKEDGIKIIPTTNDLPTSSNPLKMREIYVFNNTVMGTDKNGISINKGVINYAQLALVKEIDEVYVNNNIITDFNRISGSSYTGLRFVSYSPNASSTYDQLVHAGNNIIQQNRFTLDFNNPNSNTQGAAGPGNTTDLRLQQSSPAVNSGIKIPKQNVPVSSYTTTDFGGATRISSTRVDCGAYEFAGTPTSTPLKSTEHCNYALASSTTGFNATNVPPGSTVCLCEDRRNQLRVKSPQGTSANPITFVAVEDIHEVETTSNSSIPAIKLTNAEHIDWKIEETQTFKVRSHKDGIECLDCSGDIRFSGMQLELFGMNKRGFYLNSPSNPGTPIKNIRFERITIDGNDKGTTAIKANTSLQNLLVDRCHIKEFKNGNNSNIRAIEVKIDAAGDRAKIYNSVFDGFDLSNSVGDLIFFIGGNLNAVSMYQNTFVNLSNYRIFRRHITNIGSFRFVNNAIQTDFSNGTSMLNTNYQGSNGWLIYPNSINPSVQNCFLTNDVNILGVDAMTYYPLQSANSPLLNSGVMYSGIAELNQDFKGAPRPESIHDIGACEWQPGYAMPLSNGEITTHQNVQLYPNPFKGDFTIQLPEGSEKAQIRVFSVTGQLLTTAKLQNGASLITVPQNYKGVILVEINDGKHTNYLKAIAR